MHIISKRSTILGLRSDLPQNPGSSSRSLELASSALPLPVLDLTLRGEAGGSSDFARDANELSQDHLDILMLLAYGSHVSSSALVLCMGNVGA
jgi:hypothetical protein